MQIFDHAAIIKAKNFDDAVQVTRYPSFIYKGFSANCHRTLCLIKAVWPKICKKSASFTLSKKEEKDLIEPYDKFLQVCLNNMMDNVDKGVFQQKGVNTWNV